MIDLVENLLSISRIENGQMDLHLSLEVVINLVNNAVKNTPVGSKITIRSEQIGHYVYVYVEDNGPGISDDMKPHIFEMFYTGKNVVSARYSKWISLTESLFAIFFRIRLTVIACYGIINI